MHIGSSQVGMMVSGAGAPPPSPTFVIGENNGGDVILSSATGATGTYTTNTGPVQNGYLVGALAFDGVHYCFAGQGSPTSKGATSTTISSWSGSVMPAAGGWCCGASTSRIVAVLRSGTNSAYSTDGGATWTAGGTLPVSDSWNRVIFAFGLFIALGQSGNLVTSPDGLTWTQRTFPSGGAYIDMVFGNGIIVAVDQGSGADTTNYVTSTDGINWTAQTLPSAQGLNCIAYDSVHGNFCAISGAKGAGTGSAISMTSSTGLTGSWTTRTNLPASQFWQAIGWNGTNLLIIGTNTTQAGVSSDGGVTFSSATLPSSKAWKVVTR